MGRGGRRDFPTEGERRLFGKDVLERAARAVAEGRRLPLKSDVAFKLFLSGRTRESRACLRGLLSAVTGREVRRARVVNPELLPDIVGRKRPRLDVNCEFGDGELADIELQLTGADDDQGLRAMFYGAKLLAGTLGEGGDYGELPPVYQVFLVDFDPFGDGEFYHRAMMRLDDGSVFSDRLQVRFFNLRVPGRVGEGLQKAANWCRFISGAGSADVLSRLATEEDWKEELAMAVKAYGRITDERRAWAYHLSMDRAEADYRNGLRRGRKKAREEGHAEGLAEGRQQGLAEGREEAMLEAARRLLAMGQLEEAQVAQATGLPPERVRRLAEEG